MDGKITVQYLQAYIKSKDHSPQHKHDYFQKLTEEMGELSRAMRLNLRPTAASPIKETIEEELWDVMYYVLALANCYEIDLESIIPLKEQINNVKYGTPVCFDPK